jgi:hypothetical protein
VTTIYGRSRAKAQDEDRRVRRPRQPRVAPVVDAPPVRTWWWATVCFLARWTWWLTVWLASFLVHLARYKTYRGWVVPRTVADLRLAHQVARRFEENQARARAAREEAMRLRPDEEPF